MIATGHGSPLGCCPSPYLQIGDNTARYCNYYKLFTWPRPPTGRSSFTIFRGPRRAGGTPPYQPPLPTPAPPYRYDPFRLVLMAENRLAPSTSGLPPARLPQVMVASMDRRPGPAALRRPHRARRPGAGARPRAPRPPGREARGEQL